MHTTGKINEKNDVSVLPHSKDAEMLILGCALTSEYAHKYVAETLKTDDLFINEHRLILQVLKEAYVKGKNADVHLVCEWLKEKLDGVGGASYITTLAQYAGTSTYVEEYIDEIKNHALCRKTILMLQVKQRSFFDCDEPMCRLEECQKSLSDLSKNYSPNDKALIGDILSGQKSLIDSDPFIERIETRKKYFDVNRKPFLTGLPTGFSDVDNQAAILEDSNLIILAARPAMGKTALALQIGLNISTQQNKSVAFISLEMSRDQLAERLISMTSGISLEKMKRGQLTAGEIQALKDENERMKKIPFFILDKNISSISHIIARTRRLKDEEDIGLLVIDYLQLLGSDKKTDSRQYEVADVSRRLKQLALELQIPILCVAQLSRKVEERSDKKPLLSDLRDSGQIEQDCDIAAFLYRADYYNPQESPGEVQFIVAKNRNGPLLTANLFFKKECGYFRNLKKQKNVEHSW